MSGTDYDLTPILGLFKPVPDADDDAWGAHLNLNADVLDNALMRTGGQMLGPLITQAGVGGSGLGIGIGNNTTGFWSTTGNILVLQCGGAANTLFSPTGNQMATTAMLGTLTLQANAASAMQAVPLQQVQSLIAAIPGGATITVGDVAPATPADGSLWFDSLGTQLYLRYNDGNSTQWVPTTNQNGAVQEAPTDGGYYTRHNSAWSNVATAPQVQANVGRNLVHNGLFNVQQRGQGPWVAGGGFAYTADRWWIANSLDTSNCSLQDQTTPEPNVNDDAMKSYFANTFTGNAGAGSYTVVAQSIEDVRRLSGKSVVVSFWAQSAQALRFGVSLTQVWGSGGSPAVDLNGQSVQLTNSWARYSLTFTLPDISGQIASGGEDSTQLLFWYSAGSDYAARSGNVGVQSGAINLWGIQLEIGSVATPLEKLDPADDLRHCQRFFVASPPTNYLTGYEASAGIFPSSSVALPVPMRSSATVTITPQAGGSNTASATVSSVNSWSFVVNVGVSAAGSYVAAYTYTASADL